jgi:hypothetical protein
MISTPIIACKTTCNNLAERAFIFIACKNGRRKELLDQCTAKIYLECIISTSRFPHFLILQEHYPLLTIM